MAVPFLPSGQTAYQNYSSEIQGIRRDLSEGAPKVQCGHLLAGTVIIAVNKLGGVKIEAINSKGEDASAEIVAGTFLTDDTRIYASNPKAAAAAGIVEGGAENYKMKASLAIAYQPPVREID